MCTVILLGLGSKSKAALTPSLAYQVCSFFRSACLDLRIKGLQSRFDRSENCVDVVSLSTLFL
jgi:hypothetical protein